MLWVLPLLHKVDYQTRVLAFAASPTDISRCGVRRPRNAQHRPPLSLVALFSVKVAG